MKTRILANPHVNVVHPRPPEESSAQLWMTLTWLNGQPGAAAELSEDGLVDLAAECLSAARILRRVRRERAGRA